MQRDELLRLDAAAAGTAGELDDDLGEAVRSIAAQRLREAVLERFTDAPAELRSAVEKLRIDPGEGRGLGRAVVEDLRAEGVDGTMLDEAEVRVGSLPDDAEDGPLGPDTPLQANPLLTDVLARARMERLGALAGVTTEKTQAVFAAGVSAGNLDDDALEKLVASGKLDGLEARGLGFAATLVRLLDDDVALAERLRDDLDAIPDRHLGAVRRLVGLRTEDWEARLEGAGLELPNGLDIAQYARLLTARLETAFPTDALAERVAARDVTELGGELQVMQPLFESNERVFGDGCPSFDAVGGEQHERVERAYCNLRRLVDENPGLGLGAVLDDTTLSPDERLARVQSRIRLLPRLAELNPTVELLEVDLSAASDDADQINFGELSDDERSGVTANLKAYQRAHALTGDISDAQAVLAAGYDSASSVLADPFERFLERTRLPVSSAATYYGEARAAGEAVASAIGTVLEGAGEFRSLAVGNVAPSTREFFRGIDGYEDLFGEQDYCRCEECASLLSPAAYYVDLMSFVESHLLNRAFAGAAANHPLNLQRRRPDLWTLELTCANTDRELPLLEIVDKLLEDHIARQTGFAGNLGDQAAVWRHVYRERVATAADSFAQPFLLPLERVEVYLAHFALTRGEIAALLGAGADEFAAATLRLSRREWELVTEPNTARGFLERIYRTELPFAPDGTLFRIEAHDLLRAIAVALRKDAIRPEPADERESKIVRDDLAALLATRFVGQLRIQGERRGLESIQNDVEYVYGPSSASLDRLHRFVRLWRTLDWSPDELDLVLGHLGTAGLAGGIDPTALRRICQLLGLERRFQLSVEELIVLFHLLPTAPVAPATEGLFDRRFNGAGLVELGGRLPRDDVELVHPVLRDDPAEPSAADWALRRLLAGLAVGADQLLELIRGLAVPLGVDLSPGAPEADRGFGLSHGNLSLLYRHARLADWLGLTLPTLFRLAELAPNVAQGYAATFDDVRALIDFHDWFEDCPGDIAEIVEDLAFITGRPVGDESRFPDPVEVAALIVERVERDGSLIFADTLFAELDGVSEAESRAIVSANAPATLTALGEGRYRLADTFDPASPIEIPDLPDDVTVDEGAARELLAPHHASRIVPALLSTELGVDEAKATALVALTGRTLTDPALAQALRGEDPSTPTALEQLVGTTIPLATLFEAERLDASSVAFVRDHRDVFALDPANIDVEAAMRVESYRRLARPLNAASSDPALRAADLREALAAFDPATGFRAEGQAPLANVLGVEAAVSRSLEANVALPDTPLAALERLQTAAEIATRLGIDGKTLALTAAEDYDSLAIAAAGLFAAIRAKYPDETDWQERSEPFEGRILGRRRDGLADFLVFSADVPRRPLHRLVNSATRDRFYTTSDDERNAAVSQGDYVSEGDACWVYTTPQPGTVPLHRLVGQEEDGNVYHFYTTSDDERDRWIDMLGYNSEGEAGWVYAAPQPDSRPLHHLGTGGGRLYTTSDAERDRAVAQFGYFDQGEACWVPSAPFRSREDLYRYFLIDVEVDGCFPTSPVVAAMGSLQLYVHRVLMNLEQDDDGNLNVRPDWVPHDQWERREHFRVWQAGARVFLHTESYLGPDVRDDKTPLFEALETELLQNDIDEQAVLDAYGRYLAGFQELASLAIAGAYHDIDRVNKRDVLHLIGVTTADPPSFYYRAVENAYHGALINSSAGTVWGPWRPMDVQIPARKVAPIVHQGRLHVFWVEITTTPQNEITEGKSRFVGYTHRLAVKFSTLRLDGSWTAPQRVGLYGVPPFEESDGVLDDPLAEPGELPAFGILTNALAGFGTFSLRELLRQNPQFEQLFRSLIPRYERAQVADAIHTKVRDGYTLRGFEWEQVYPESAGDELLCVGAGYEMRAAFDLFGRRALEANGTLLAGSRLRTVSNPAPPAPMLCISRYQFEVGRFLRYVFPTQQVSVFDDYAMANVVADSERAARLFNGTSLVKAFDDFQFAGTPLARLPVGGWLAPVNGSLVDAILELPALRPVAGGDYRVDNAAPNQLYLLQASVRDGSRWLVRRLGTTLAEALARTLFTRGVDGLLDLDTQRSLVEPPTGGSAPPPTPLALAWQPGAPIDDAVVAGRIDFTGSLGSYFREIFLHTPLLIARHLHGQGHYAEAQRWYNKLFDPTAREIVADDPNVGAQENAARRRDRVWRYVEFRGLNAPTMQRILTDRQALEAYRRDPFNAHAIARVRLSAYQKAIVVGYVKLLLDWADFLFGQFEQETLNEATMLYATAADILGERPAELGACGAPDPQPRTYERFRERLRKAGPFLTELEQWIWVQNGPKDKKRPTFTLDPGSVAIASTRATALPSMRAAGVLPGTAGATPVAANGASGADGDGAPVAVAAVRGGASAPVALAASPHNGDGPLIRGSRVPTLDWNVAGRPTESPLTPNGGQALAPRGFELPSGGDGAPSGPGFGYTLVRQISPGFCAPPNRDLIGLWDSVEDRLWKLRHCRDITGARRDLSLFAPEIAPDLLQRARREGLSPEDVLGTMMGDVPPYRFAFLVAKAKEHAAAVQALGSALLEALGRKDAEELNELRAVHEQQLLTLTTNVRRWQYDAADATLESLRRRRTGVDNRRAHFQSLIDGGLRPEEWAQRLAQHAALESQTVETGLNIAAGVVHLVAQLGAPTALKYGGKEVGDSLDSFATATRAQGALQSAQGATAAMEAGFARRDEEWRQQLQAAQDELADIDKQIAAAELQRDIAQRETELHERTLTQNTELRDFYGDRFTTVELYRWQSQQLLTLHRESFGAAYALARMALRAYRFERDENAADVLSRNPWEPGRSGLLAGARLANELSMMERRFLETDIRELEIQQSFSLEQIDPAALIRLKQTGECEFTIPEFLFDLAYRGHYRRRIRQVALTVPAVRGPFATVSARLELLGSQIRRDADAVLSEVPLAGSVVIAASRAQSDSGAFELSFRDERLAPFEGAGAVQSRWRLTMPQSLPQWNYQSMSDVVVQLAYTARDDEDLRGRTEAAITSTLANRRLTRAFSLQREFSAHFNRLLSSAVGAPVKLELESKHMPFYLGRRQPTILSARLAVRPAEGQPLGSLALTLNGTSLRNFAADAQLGGLPTTNARAALAPSLLREHELTIANAGALAPDEAGAMAVGAGKLEDIVLYVEYEVPADPPPVSPDDATAGRRRRGGTARRRTRDPLAALKRKADGGDAAAAFTLWLRLKDDDSDAAERYLRTGAELGDVAAAYQLGLLLWRERDDPEGAIALLDRGASGGDPGAMRDLGLLLRERGDVDGAIYWLRRAVESNAEGAVEALTDAERQAAGEGGGTE
jgi:hypothetical protein